MTRFVSIALLALLASCRGADARPDEFSLEVGSGWGDESGQVGARDFDASGDGQWIAVGLVWYLDAAARPPAIRAPVEPPAPPVAAPVLPPEPEAAPTPELQPAPEEPLPEPADEPLPVVRGPGEDWPWAGLPTFAGVSAAGAALVLAWFQREALKKAGRWVQRAAIAWVNRAE